MSLREPEHKTESEEADWLYDHRALIQAEFLVKAAAGLLLRRNSRTGEHTPVPAADVSPLDLAEARKLLSDSGLWTEDVAPPVSTHAALRKAS